MIAEVYRNLKKGTLYRVLHRAVDCTNARDGNRVVVYQAVDDPGLVFVRDEAEFLVKFVLADGAEPGAQASIRSRTR